MEKGINLSLTKSLARFYVLLDRAIVKVASRKLTVAHKAYKPQTNPSKFDDIFDTIIFPKKWPVEHGGADSALSQGEIDALLSGGDLPAMHELNDDTVMKFRVGKYVQMGTLLSQGRIPKAILR